MANRRTAIYRGTSRADAERDYHIDARLRAEAGFVPTSEDWSVALGQHVLTVGYVHAPDQVPAVLAALVDRPELSTHPSSGAARLLHIRWSLPPRLAGALGSDRGLAMTLGVGAALVYALVGPEQRGTSSFPDLADAFLHGRDYLIGPRPWEELAIRAAGGFWVPFPPFPAALVVPVVAVLGAGFDLALASAVVGGLAVVLAYQLARDLGVTKPNAVWLAVAMALGSELLWVAGEGGHHLFAQAVALALVLGALRLAVGGRWPLLGGLLLGAAVASRLPSAAAIPVAAALYVGEPIKARLQSPRVRRSLVLLGAPILVVALLLGAYNAARFGSPFDFGYGLIVSGADQQAGCIPATCTYPTSEPWFSNGIESISYIPRSIGKMLFDGFRIVPTPPFLVPSWDGLSIALTMPVLALMVLAAWSRPWITVAGVALVGGLTLDLAHGSWGFSQIGWRFIVDVMPLAWLLLSSVAATRGLGRASKALIAWGIAVNVCVTAAAWLGLAAF